MLNTIPVILPRSNKKPVKNKVKNLKLILLNILIFLFLYRGINKSLKKV